MNHLSGVDAMFLHVESPEMPMHVGSLNVLDLPEGYAGDFYEDAKAHVASRMHLASLFTRKLALMPFDLSNPVWVEDEDIDIEHHIRHITLPKPGSNRQLQQYVARLHSSLLDRSRPLWEMFVIDGLKSGQVAVYVKAHHAGMDGQAGVAVAQAIFDLTPTGRVVKKPRPTMRRNQYQLGMAELAGAAARNTLAQVIQLVRTAPAMARALRDVALPAKSESGKRDWSLPKSLKLFGPRTMLNVAITNQRSFAGRTIPLAEAKFIGKTLGGSLNDVVMCTTAGALRRYLREYNDLPAKSLVAAVPVSLREAGDSSANNQVSMVLNTLATDIKDPVERLRAIHTASNANKAMMGRVKTAIPTDFPMLGAPWLVSGLASLFGRSRLANVMPPIANVLISNVPGSPVPLYLAGAKVISYYPVSIPAHSMALNVTVQSYDGRLDYGLIACRRAVPDINDLGDFLLAEHLTLLARAQEHAAAALAKEQEAAKAPATKRPANKAAPKTQAAVATAKPKSGKGKLALVSAEPAPVPRKRAAAKRTPAKRAAA
jgi:diacylglycerol O-acyltransferase / wax synthase